MGLEANTIGSDKLEGVNDSPLASQYSGMKLILVRISLIIFGVFFTLVVLEVAFRVFVPTSAVPDLKVINARPLVQYPSSAKVETDQPKNVGLDRAYSKAYRIVVIGGSITSGEAMHAFDAFPARLENLLNLEDSSQSVEVVTVADPSVPALLNLTNVKGAIEKHNPNLILLQLTLNDIQPFARVSRSEENYSWILSIVHNQIVQHWRSLGYFVNRVVTFLANRERIAHFTKAFSNNEIKDRFLNNLFSLNRLARERNVPLVIVLFPFLSHALDESNPFRHLHEELRQTFRRAHLVFIDLFSSYAGRNVDLLQIAPGIDHRPNEIAHRIATDALYGFLVRRAILPEELIGGAMPARRVKTDRQ